MENLGEFIVNHWILVTLFVLLLAMIMSDSLNRKLSGISPVNTAQAIQIVNQQKGQFLDIREAAEFKKEHIADSLSMPLSTLADNLAKLKKKDQPLVLVCASGQRTRAAAKQLHSEGFSEIHVLSGGLNAWKEAKLPLFS